MNKTSKAIWIYKYSLSLNASQTSNEIQWNANWGDSMEIAEKLQALRQFVFEVINYI